MARWARLLCYVWLALHLVPLLVWLTLRSRVPAPQVVGRSAGTPTTTQSEHPDEGLQANAAQCLQVQCYARSTYCTKINDALTELCVFDTTTLAVVSKRSSDKMNTPPRPRGLLHVAGLPVFPRVFARDSILSALLLDTEGDMLVDVLRFASQRMGKTRNKITGEEPGKIAHEVPGVVLRGGLSTEYNAIDTTPLFVIGMYHLRYNLGKVVDERLAVEFQRCTEAAVAYIVSHVSYEQLYIEDPTHAGGALEYALKVTYWKDSTLAGRAEGKPRYPATYTLAHAQAMCALRCASRLLDDRKLLATASRMQQAMEKYLVDHTRGTLHIGRDSFGVFPGDSSDALHALFYLSASDLPSSLISSIEQHSVSNLATEYGFLPFASNADVQVFDKYHVGSIWLFEQAFIHAAARYHSLSQVQAVSFKSFDALKSTRQFPERIKPPETSSLLFLEKIIGASPLGSPLQLWTVAAAHYFDCLGAQTTRDVCSLLPSRIPAAWF